MIKYTYEKKLLIVSETKSGKPIKVEVTLLIFTYFCRMTSRKVIIEKNKEDLNIKMDNKRAA